MISLSVANNHEACEPRAEDRGHDAGARQTNKEWDGEDLAENLFFGKASAAALARRVFERCHLAVRKEGYVFVRLRLRSQGKAQILQVVAERNDGEPMTVADCATLSRFLSPLLEGEGLVSQQTQMEVSSPGLERPLTRLSDFRRFAGAEVVLGTDRQTGKEKTRGFRATLVGVEGRSVVVRSAEEHLSIPIENLLKARLIAVVAPLPAAKPSASDSDSNTG